jgi:type II secretory pathway pseudopilin PulG
VNRHAPANLRADRRRAARGFTLIEAALATLIIGTGFVATMGLFAACTTENRFSSRMSVAQTLATSIQEATGGLSFADPGTGYANFGRESNEASVAVYDDVDDFDRVTFSPPIDAMRRPIPELAQYSQVVTVWPVYPNRLHINSDEANPQLLKTGTAPNCTAPYTGAVRVRVRVMFAATASDVPREVYQCSWIVMDK